MRFTLRLLGTTELRDEGGVERRALLVQPKRLALFAYLTLAGGRLHRREALVALFWPESSDDLARLSLRQSLHFFRRTLGPDVLATRGDEIGVAPGVVSSDAAELDSAMADGRHADVLALYRGPLLHGFHAAGVSPDFERWLDDERARLHALATRAATALADDAERADNPPLAAARARDVLRLAPLDEPAIRRLVRALHAAGDRVGALRAYEAFAARLAAELEAEPTAETRALVETIRHADGPPVAPAYASVRRDGAPQGTLPLPSVVHATPDVRGRRRPPVRLAAAAAGLAAAAALLGTLATGRVAESPGNAVAAQRLYEEGVRAFYRGDPAASLRLFERALGEDSTLTLAAYYGARAALPTRGDTAAMRLASHAMRASRAGPERDRLFAAAVWAEQANDPSWVARADSLATRFPDDPDALLSLGRALMWAGEYPRAVAPLQRVVRRQRAVLGAGATIPLRDDVPCSACDALQLVVAAHAYADSLGAAERAARDWVALQPTYYAAWLALAGVQEAAGRLDEALASRREASRLAGRDLADATVRAVLAMRAGDFATAERLLSVRAADGDPAARDEARWWQVLVLRQQGRLREALRVVDELDPRRYASLPARVQVLLESGDARASAAAAESLAAHGPPETAPRRRAWNLTHAATAYAAAGDTARVAALAREIEAYGARSAYGRDRRIHHYARGLVAEARGDLAGAERELRAAVTSPTYGYTRINYALGRVLMALGRPREAAAAIRPALHGDVQSSNYWVSRTELHEALARALHAAGERDSAAAHLAHVVAAWRGGDPPFRARADALRRLLVAGTTASR